MPVSFDLNVFVMSCHVGQRRNLLLHYTLSFHIAHQGCVVLCDTVIIYVFVRRWRKAVLLLVTGTIGGFALKLI